jgi:protoheme IX farnesyltransferase
MTEIAGSMVGTAGWRLYFAICKPRIVTLICFTAVVGMLLSTDGLVPWQPFVFGIIGIGLAASSAASINHVIDQRIDTLMDRTRSRPLATGQLSTAAALTWAFALAIISMLVLALLVNPLVAALTFASLIGYAVIYTAFLKRTTHHNIELGGFAGAAPPLLGWVAITGQVELPAVLLFLIISVWTPPHFWPLAIKRRDDYKRAGIPMLPVTRGVEVTKRWVLFYMFVLLGVSVLPYTTGMSGLLYLAGALGLGAGFLYHVVTLFRTDGDSHSMATFKFSILYLYGLFLFLLADHYLADVLMG